MIYFNYERFEDVRGYVAPIFRKGDIPSVHFVEDRISVGYKHVIKGFHGDEKTFKLFICLEGEVELREFNLKSKKWNTIRLAGNQNLMALVMPNTLNAHQVLSDKAIILYKWSHVYTSPEKQFSVYPLDTNFIDKPWPLDGVILSDRDQTAPTFAKWTDKYYGGLYGKF